MSITPGGGWKVQAAEIAERAPLRREIACPNCYSDEWKSAGLVYNEGISVSQSRTKGTILGVGRIGFSHGRTGVGGGVYQSRSSGVSQTSLSQMATPPRMRTGAIAVMGLICIALAFQIVHTNVADGRTEGIFDALGGFVIGAFFIAIYKWKRGAYLSEMNAYRNTRMCQRCGTFYHAT